MGRRGWGMRTLKSCTRRRSLTGPLKAGNCSAWKIEHGVKSLRADSARVFASKSWSPRLGIIARQFKVVGSSSKERESVPQDGVNDLRATFVSADCVAEVAVDEGVNNL